MLNSALNTALRVWPDGIILFFHIRVKLVIKNVIDFIRKPINKPVWLPATIIPMILRHIRDMLVSAHTGQKKTVLIIKKEFYWISMQMDIVEYVSKYACQCAKQSFK
ncbi:hypothetical protein PR048_005094 [Dryococelus australis]|uniref:Integrase zinc-binding domain-containing protein n=1 Tax=Dryococelus australis TaxID=614101 RepID=A0ABQ9I783_9NEOP|nr:hypothetical protein PR048_005094 [Dryococelus australis]